MPEGHGIRQIHSSRNVQVAVSTVGTPGLTRPTSYSKMTDMLVR